MSNYLRKFRRKEQKQWSYEQYKRERLARQKNIQIEKARKEFIDIYQRIVPNIIPEWQTKLALCFPPLWYNNTVCYILRIISPKKNREILLQLDKRWRRSFFRMFRFWLANTIYTITIRSMLKLRTFINEFGITSKIDTIHKEDKEFIRYKIFRFTKCFHEEMIPL